MIKALKRLMLTFIASFTLLFSSCSTRSPNYKAYLDYSEISLNFNGHKQLTVQSVFKDDIQLTNYSIFGWTSDNSEVATVNKNGYVTAVNAGETFVSALIKVPDNSKNILASCKVVVYEDPGKKYDYTLMFYMSGSTLENDPSIKKESRGSSSGIAVPGLISQDIKEILSVDLPTTVKVIIETGGTTMWDLSATYLDGATSISHEKLQRWEVADHKLKLLETVNTNFMASEQSFEDFLKWGMLNYPAEQMGVIISGHGLGIAGCATDDNYTYYYEGQTYKHVLNAAEIVLATKTALSEIGKDKLTWIGFDCCLMQSIDIASVLADYYDYMVASQEIEAGEGWRHDIYMQKLVENPKATPNALLPAIVSSYKNDVHTTYCSHSEIAYETLSVLDLTKMNTFVSEFNSYVSKVGADYSQYEVAFKNAYNQFGNGTYGLVDFKSYIEEIGKIYTTVSSENLLNALNTLVISNEYCESFSTALCGVNAFLPVCISEEEKAQLTPEKEDYTGQYATKFTTYQSMCLKNGDWVW